MFIGEENKTIKNYRYLHLFLPLFCLLLVVFLFNFPLVNKFFPATEGWFQDYARYINQGYIPYKDFYCPVSVGFLWVVTTLSHIFGDSFIVLRYYGLIERILFAAITFVLIHKVYSDRVSTFAVFTALIIYISNWQDIFNSYYQSALLFAFVAVYFCVKMLENPLESNKYAVCFGILSALSFFMKQNVGPIFALIIGCATAFLLYRKIGWQKVAIIGAISLASALAVISVMVVYLHSIGALLPFLDSVFKGASSKGSIYKIFFGFFDKMNHPKTWIVLGSIAVWLALDQLLAHYRTKFANALVYYCVAGFYLFLPLAYFYKYFVLAKLWLVPDEGTILKWLFGIIIFAFLVFQLCRYMDYDKLNKKSQIIWYSSFSMLYVGMIWLINREAFTNIGFLFVWGNRQILSFALFYCLSGWIIYAIFKNSRSDELKDKIKLLLLIVAWTNLYIHSMSNVIEDHGTLLLYALVFAELLSTRLQFNTYKNYVVVIFCIANIFVVDVQRHNFPYYWWGVNAISNVYSAKYSFKDPKLKGFLGERKYVQTMNNIYDLVNDNKRQGDSMYTFPHINYFNVMGDLNAPTFAKVHYFDVCPDNVAVSDARILKNTKPTFIVWMELPEQVWGLHEKLFRAGNRSGQRIIKKVIEAKVNSGDYTLLGKYILGASNPVYIYGINDGRQWRIPQ